MDYQVDPIEEKGKRLKEVREELFWDDWAIHWLINSLDSIKSQDE
jgi:hypothetical protein